MANVRPGTLTPPRQRWRHLRDWKQEHHKRERRAWRQAIPALLEEPYPPAEALADADTSLGRESLRKAIGQAIP